MHCEMLEDKTEQTMKSSQRDFFFCKNCLSLAQNSFLWLVEQPRSWQHHHNFCVRSVLPPSTKVRFQEVRCSCDIWKITIYNCCHWNTADKPVVVTELHTAILKEQDTVLQCIWKYHIAMWAAGEIHVSNTLSFLTERILLCFLIELQRSLVTRSLVRLVYHS